VIEQLAHPVRAGSIGVWTYRPAYFADLTVAPCEGLGVVVGVPPAAPDGAVTEWLLDEREVVCAEPSGAVNLCRYVSPTQLEAVLMRRFHLERETEVAISLGFSDTVILELDGVECFRGENKWLNTDDPAEQGTIDVRALTVRRRVSAGEHTLAAVVGVKEPFGWGLALAAHAQGLSWLPAATS
jgi:hypothetical protein